MMKFAVIGGDMRIAHLCRLLSEDGNDVSSFALEGAEDLTDTIPAKTLEAALSGAGCVVLPLPCCSQSGVLNAPLSAKEYAISDIFSSIAPGSLVCAGRVDEETGELAKRSDLNIIDYFAREELAVYNAVATAEGAIGIVIRETPATIWKSKILVIGFGRIGKLLAVRLLGLGADVTVSARKFEDIAWIESLGCKSANTLALEGLLAQFDVIINTVPALVLPESRLLEMTKHALCVDLASIPGGMDFTAASRLGIKTVWALGLPGEVAPETSGAIIRDTIKNIICEQENLNVKT